jgi:uncharacterized RDD family membrane protein YckC
MSTAAPQFEYVGFWARVWASVIDTILVLLVCTPLFRLLGGPSAFESVDPGKVDWNTLAFVEGPIDFFVNWVLPAVGVVLFWIYRQATPGKIAIGARIVDARTGGTPSTGQLIGRYLGYYVSLLGLGLGFVWIAFDPRKQGWHDKLAGTVVVRERRDSKPAPGQ